MRSQRSSRSVSPYLTVACVQVPARKFPKRLPTTCLYLLKLLLLPLCVHLCIGASVRWALSLERHQRATDFDPGGICGGLLFAPPFALLESKAVIIEFVELGDKYCNCHRRHWDYRLVPPGTTHYIREHRIYVRECRVCTVTCRIRMNMNIWMRTYPLWRTYSVPGSILFAFVVVVVVFTLLRTCWE